MSFFKKFFSNVVKKRDTEEDDSFEFIKKVPVYHGTVHPYPNFNPRKDAVFLEEAINSRNVDEDTIISVLAQRNNAQRQEIKQAYESSTGKCLVKELKSELRSHLEDVVVGLLMTPAQFDAFLLRKATKGLGTDEDVLVEVLASRTNQEIRELARAFEEEYGETLEEVIENETDGDFAMALLAMLKANKNESHTIDTDLAKQDARDLFEAGEEMKGIDISVFIDILTSRSGPQLAKTFKDYSKISDVNLPKALDMELKGDIEDCLIDIVKCAWSKPAFFAEKLNNAMKGHGTCEDSLLRVMVSRSEVDLKKIMMEFKLMYGRSLQECILVEKEHSP
ncbi:Annexin A1 [Merluccius polli]|uniref:Annexin n=1 Tax=Merluccius polli TaxID=89951 RepID=A0AA47MPZ2_MERPO|nr:Annexin A1 [Merluccius polli]